MNNYELNYKILKTVSFNENLTVNSYDNTVFSKSQLAKVNVGKNQYEVTLTTTNHKDLEDYSILYLKGLDVSLLVKKHDVMSLLTVQKKWDDLTFNQAFQNLQKSNLRQLNQGNCMKKFIYNPC
jgi:hypothetical protein